jgi:hypothetical protein
LLLMKGLKTVACRLRFWCGCWARCRLQSLFWTTHQTRTRRDAMAIRWQADMVRPQMGGAVGSGPLHACGSALYLAGFDLCPAKRARGRTGISALLGDSHSRPHIRFEDGAKGVLGPQERGRPRSDGTFVLGLTFGSRIAPCPRPLFPQQRTSGFGNGMSGSQVRKNSPIYPNPIYGRRAWKKVLPPRSKPALS